MAQKKVETKKFGAEVGKILQLMIHSLYTNKDIFLRELISNASDALDKLRYLAIEDPKLLKEDHELKIKISIDKNIGSLIIEDNGIGMNKEDLINNLGTIASSGTQKFLQNLNENPKGDINLIGQFGVGFYSAFMVAEEVTVITRKAGEAETYIWKSTGEGDYSIAIQDEVGPRGTRIILKLRAQEVEFLEKYKLKHIISTYSDHISFPIEFTEDDKTEIMNTASALWARPKSEVTEEQYNEFYHHVAHLPDTPWLRIHTKAEGNVEYTSLLYIPTIKPFDLFDPKRETRVKLYVKKVFITDENAQLIPAYMRFLRGVVDSEDLPLNISRETLQHNAIVDKIRKSIVKKVLSELKNKAKNNKAEYAEFWKNFGEVLKEGLCEGAFEEKEQLLEVCRFYSTKSNGELISIEEYIDRMVEGQNEIFYITGDNIEALKNHPRLEGFNKRDIEVILLADHVDDFWVNVVNQYKNKELKNVSASNIELDNIKKFDEAEDKDQVNEKDSKSLTEFIKKTLGDIVKEVKVSSKLIDSPACLALAEGNMSMRMEKLLIEQKQLKSSTAKILEINLKHPIIKKISIDIANDNTNAETEDLVHIIYDQACVLENEHITDPKAFTNRINDFIKRAVNI